MGASASSIAQKLIDKDGLKLAERGVSEMPKTTGQAFARPNNPKSALDGVIEILGGREPAFVAIQRLADKRKHELAKCREILGGPLLDPAKSPPFIEERLLEQNAQKIVDYLAEKRSASPPISEEHPIYRPLTEDEYEDQEEWARGWVFLDRRVYPARRNDHPEWRGERRHLKVLVRQVVNDTPSASSLIDRKPEHGEIAATVDELMADNRLTGVKRESVERIFRNIRTGN